MISIPITQRPTLLKLGKTFITKGALEAITDAQQTPLELLLRHIHRDWGEVTQEDKRINDWAFENGEWVLSAYSTTKGVRIWVITEWDRSMTTILLPGEH